MEFSRILGKILIVIVKDSPDYVTKANFQISLYSLSEIVKWELKFQTKEKLENCERFSTLPITSTCQNFVFRWSWKLTAKSTLFYLKPTSTVKPYSQCCLHFLEVKFLLEIHTNQRICTSVYTNITFKWTWENLIETFYSATDICICTLQYSLRPPLLLLPWITFVSFETSRLCFFFSSLSHSLSLSFFCVV